MDKSKFPRPRYREVENKVSLVCSDVSVRGRVGEGGMCGIGFWVGKGLWIKEIAIVIV